MLILTTQAGPFVEFGRWVQLGESDETDFRLLVATVELLNDVVFEAVTISFWRLTKRFEREREKVRDPTVVMYTTTTERIIQYMDVSLILWMYVVFHNAWRHDTDNGAEVSTHTI